jgi:polyisoprenoid-binding protein YceI
MKFAAFTIATLSVFFTVTARAADTYVADPVHSSVVFKVKHLNTSNAWGRFNAIAGSFTLDSADPSKSKLDFTVKAASVDTNNEARDKHLQSPDFFNAVQYPEIKFVSKSVSKSTEGYEVTGELNFHGVTKPLSFVLTQTGAGKDMRGNAIAGVEANFIVKQSDFGITKMAAAIGDEVTVWVSIEGIKK